MSKKKNVLFSTKLMLSYALFFSAVVFLILTGVFFILRENNRKQAELTNQILLNQSLSQLDRFFADMDKVAYQIMTNNVLIAKFTMLQEEQKPENYFVSNVLEYIDTASVLTNINGSFKPFWRISVYNNYGDFISTGTVMAPEVVQQTLARTDVWAHMLLLRDGEYRILSPQKDRWSNYFRSDYLSFQRPLMNIYSKKVMGVVEIQQNVSGLIEAMRLQDAPGVTLNLYDEMGKAVLWQKKDNDQIIAAGTLDTYSWTVELYQSPEVHDQQERKLFLLLFIAWIASTLMMYILVYIIAKRLSRPLTALTHSVQNISVANPQLIELESGASIQEVVELGNAFNNMLERLIFSAEQEKQAFLLAMQAQVNPHFIYNVLSVIQAVAMENRTHTIMQICGNLSSLLRYSSSYAEGSATLSEELKYTQAYLEIMRDRYDGLFRYSIEIAPPLRKMRIPKLIIQPLCENCFKHAFANIEPPYYIGIRLFEGKNGWAMCVRDNGSGFSEQQRKDILYKINHASHRDLRAMHMEGLGLVSSIVRLRLFLSHTVFCEIAQTEDGGSEITIHITYRDEEGSTT